jgi:hypothetical protein
MKFHNLIKKNDNLWVPTYHKQGDVLYIEFFTFFLEYYINWPDYGRLLTEKFCC